MIFHINVYSTNNGENVELESNLITLLNRSKYCHKLLIFFRLKTEVASLVLIGNEMMAAMKCRITASVGANIS